MPGHKEKDIAEISKKQADSITNRNRRHWFKLHEPKIREHLANQSSTSSGPRFLASTFGQPLETVEKYIAREVRDWFTRANSRGIPQRIELSELIDITDLIMRNMGKAVLEPRFRLRRALKQVREAYGDCAQLFRISYVLEGPEKIQRIREEDDRLIEFAEFAKNSALFKELKIHVGHVTVRLSDIGSAIGYGVNRLRTIRLADQVQGIESCAKMQAIAENRKQISVQCATELDFPKRYFHAGVWKVFDHVPIGTSLQTLVRLNKTLEFGAPVMMTARHGPGRYSNSGEEIEATEIKEETRPVIIPGHFHVDSPQCVTVLYTLDKFRELVTIAGFQVFKYYVTGKISDRERQIIMFTTKIKEVREYDALMKWYEICPTAENCM